jgi:hypothetical protein
MIEESPRMGIVDMLDRVVPAAADLSLQVKRETGKASAPYGKSVGIFVWGVSRKPGCIELVIRSGASSAPGASPAKRIGWIFK